MRGHPLAKRLERRPIGRELVAKLRDLGVGFVEVLHFLAEDVEVLAALAQRVHLPRRLLREIVDLTQPLVQRLERELFLRQVVGLRQQRVEPLGEAVDLLRELVQILLFRRERVHARFRIAHRALQRLQPLVDRLEFLLLHGELIHLAPD